MLGLFFVLTQLQIHACTHPTWREAPHASELEMFLGAGAGEGWLNARFLLPPPLLLLDTLPCLRYSRDITPHAVH